MKVGGVISLLSGAFLALTSPVLAQQQLLPDIIDGGGDFSVGATPGQQVTIHSTTTTFNAAGNGNSSIDHTASSGAQDAAYGGGTFLGSAYLNNIAAILANGTPSDISGGVASATALFELTNVFNCHFESSVTASGDIAGHVFLEGPDGFIFENTNGEMSGTTTLVSPGIYTLEADLRTGTNSGGTGRLSYQVSLVPGNVPAGLLGPQEKKALFSEYSAIEVLIPELLNMVDTAGSTEMASALLNAVNLLEGQAKVYLQMYLDPVDTNYTELASISLPSVIPVVPAGAVTVDEAADCNNWLSNLCQSAACSSAVLTSLNRAQGAAFAGNSYWNSAQMTAAVQFEAQLAALMDQEPLLRSNVVARFDADGFSPFSFTTNDAIAFQLEVETGGLPIAMLNTFSNLDLSTDAVTSIEFDLLTADPAEISGTFPDSLADTNLDASAAGLAAGLRDASLELINLTWLPTSQFRFDLPTEPGYIYGIQTSPDLVAWTTVFSTNATSALLSWTNTISPAVRASFYRAYHN